MHRRSIAFALLLLCAPLCAQKLPASGTSDALSAAAHISSAVKWFANDPQLLREGDRSEGRAVRKSRSENRDFDRLAALDKALAAAQAADKPVLLYIPRILAGSRGRQMYRPAIPDIYARSVFFTDPDCVTRVNARFIPLRLICDKKLGERLGISAPDRVEPALVFLSPKGKTLRIIDRIRSFNAAWFLGILAEIHGFAKAPALAEGASDEERIANALLRQREGYVIESKSITLPADSPKDLHAALGLLQLRQLRLGAIDQRLDISVATPKPMAPMPKTAEERAASASIFLELGRIATLNGDLEATRGYLGAAERLALRAFGRRPAKNAKLFPDCRAEIYFRLGIAQYFQGQDELAHRSMMQALDADPSSPFAWKAALNLVTSPDLTPLGPTLHGFEDPFRPAKTNGTTAHVPKGWTPKRQAQSAVEFLLRMQRENGSWNDSRYAYWGTKSITPNVWMATTALACASLLEWRELAPKRIDAALARGEAYITDGRRMMRGQNEEIYADAYRLLYLAHRFDRKDSSAGQHRLLETMNGIIRHLMETQKGEGRAKGFWAHEYPNPFCTAAVMSSLRAAKLRGAVLPPHMLMDAATGLLTTRDPKSGAFSYSAGRRNRGLSPKDAMARMPICEAAILWSGHKEGSQDRVRNAMENFWKYLPRLERIRVCDFHTDGELGGFFYWHGIFHTTEAIGALPSREQSAHRQRMVQHIGKLQELDGSFIDSHEIGKSYATSMALLALKNSLESSQ